MQVRLQIRPSDRVVLEGAALAQPLPDAQRAALQRMAELAGTVWLEHPGQASIEILDDLQLLVPDLCVWARRAVAAGDAITVEMSISAEKVALTPRGDDVEVQTTWGVQALFPAAELIAELRGVAHQYARFLLANRGDDPEWRDAADYLKGVLSDMGEPVAEAPEPDPHALSDAELQEIVAAVNREPEPDSKAT